jgi:hypothetical protein
MLACGVATAWLGQGVQMPSVTTRDGTLTTLNRYVNEPIPDVVLVGSSLTFRLREEYFGTPGVRNLALAGGSPVTGLEIVAEQPRLPKLILVEANVLSRATDAVTVERYARGGDGRPWLFRPVRTAVAGYERWRHAPLSHADVSAMLDRQLKEPPAHFDNQIYVDRALQQANEGDPAVATRANAERIAQLIETARQKGARVLLFELPHVAEYEAARYASTTRDIVHARFPDPAQWLKVDFDRQQLRWPDGVHLDERSAVLIARSIDKSLPTLLGGR